MPNCDFYALREDLEKVLGFVFQQSDCRVFENASALDSALVEFHSVAEIAEHFPLGHCAHLATSVSLMLFPVAAGSLVIERYSVDPAKCGGATYRFKPSGWGLIQLYLGGDFSGKIVPSHTNHNSEKRALTWEPIGRDTLGPVSEWDWSAVNGASRRINAFIRKLSVEKRGPRPVLPQAARALAEGATLA